MTGRRLVALAAQVLATESQGPRGDPLAALAATRDLELAARQAARVYAEAARAAGCTWAQAGAALGLASPAVFELVASDLGRGPVVAWKCACGRMVIDSGPDAGHPADAERGHAERCARLAADTAAWDAQWDDEEDGDG